MTKNRVNRYSQIEYEFGKSGVGPKLDSQMFKRFEDWYDKRVGQLSLPIKTIAEEPQNWVFKDDEDRPVYADPFYYNQRSLQDYYRTLAEDPLYKGMFEAIGRVTIYASQFLQNPFAKFIKDPLMSGNAHMAGLFKDIKSHEWEPGKPSNTFGVDGVMGLEYNADTSKGIGQQSEIKPFEYGLPDTGWLFRAESPEFVSTVSRINFSREIALLVNARDYARYCQTPEMVGEIGSALMGMSNAIYMNDMREASKNFFCGILRIGNDLEPTTIVNYGDKSSTNDGPPNSPMITFVDLDESKIDGDIEKRGDIIASGLSRIIHNTIEVDFADFSDKYNPSHLNRISESCTVILDSHVKYDTFKKYYATLHHPEFVKPGPEVEFIWINEFPQLGTSIFANKENYTDSWYELVGMIVDNNAMAIIPYQTPVTVQTFFNPHKESMSIFTHYQCDFEFKPFFNRKYIYLRHIYGDGNKPDQIKVNTNVHSKR